MPRAPKKCGRAGCTTRIVGRTYCDQHETEYRERSSWGRGSTRRSRRERTIVLTRDPTCYLRYDGCTGAATEDDHVIPKWRGGSDDLSNRRGACHSCHRKKSLAEAAEARAAGATR
jgi:5-methylcytosine-specific restriction protein A